MEPCDALLVLIWITVNRFRFMAAIGHAGRTVETSAPQDKLLECYNMMRQYLRNFCLSLWLAVYFIVQ